MKRSSIDKYLHRSDKKHNTIEYLSNCGADIGSKKNGILKP